MVKYFRVLATGAALSALLAGCNRNRDFGIDGYVRAYTATYSPAAWARPVANTTPLLADMDKPIGEVRPLNTSTSPIAPGGEGELPHWSIRRGPAHKDDWLRSLGRDAKEFAPIMWDDTKATFTNRWALVGFAAAGIAGVATHKAADDRIEDHYTKHGSQLNTFWDTVGDVAGNPGLHFALAGTMYFGSLGSGNTKGYETSKALLSALAINGLTTMALKGIVHTESPNGDALGWPSGHTSSSFCVATVMYEAYGPWVGVPLFALASYVGYERIDARNHDFSDVISGALIGIAIGHAVMKNHEARIFGFDVLPYADPASGAVGVALLKQF